MVHKYNLFFYANVCHVCKRFGKDVCLRRCGDCTMISYCSKEHQRQHWSQHRDLCAAIRNVLEDNKVLNFLNENQNSSQETWTRFKMSFMLIVQIKILRKLEYYEEQMFKFFRACSVCYDSKALKDCTECPSTSFCIKHQGDPCHKEACRQLRLCFNLDVILMSLERNIPQVEAPKWEKRTYLPNDIKDFIQQYIQSKRILQLSGEEEDAINSEYLTRPLTLLWVIQKLKYQLNNDNLTIHVIAANMIEMDGIELWEILLHWLPSIASMKIILIGPELSSGSMEFDLCDDCLLKNKNLTIEFYGGLYENYAVCSSFFKPQFIIGYNAGIHEREDFESEKDTWAQSLKAIAKLNCPFVLTAYTMSEAEKEEARLKAVLGNKTKRTYCTRNPFSSLRPYRDFETAGVYYQNQYVIVYKDLPTSY